MCESYEQMEAAIWSAKSLFDRKSVTGSAANLSFREGDKIFITRSGAIFGRLTEQDFAVIDLEGRLMGDVKPSKEAPIHLAMYHKSREIGAVIHTHSFYSVLWSCLLSDGNSDTIPSHTPYLSMILGRVPLVPYHQPGSEELFQAFRVALGEADGYLLKNHGPVVGGKSVIDAFARLEELEVSAKTAWYLSQRLSN